MLGNDGTTGGAEGLEPQRMAGDRRLFGGGETGKAQLMRHAERLGQDLADGYANQGGVVPRRRPRGTAD